MLHVEIVIINTKTNETVQIYQFDFKNQTEKEVQINKFKMLYPAHYDVRVIERE